MQDIPTTSVDISHHLQRQILLQLRHQGSQSYQQLKPDGVEGNAYNYHLKNLKKAGLIASIQGAYSLTATGHVVADAFSFDTGRLVLRPHIYTYLLVVAGDKVLLYEPVRQPMPGIHCLPSGKLHYGDDHPASIRREMDRRQLTNDYDSSALCMVNIRYRREGEMILQRPGMIWHIDYHGPLNDSSTPNGSASWWSVDDLKQLRDKTPEVTDSLNRLRQGSHDPIDLDVEL